MHYSVHFGPFTGGGNLNVIGSARRMIEGTETAQYRMKMCLKKEEKPDSWEQMHLPNIRMLFIASERGEAKGIGCLLHPDNTRRAALAEKTGYTFVDYLAWHESAYKYVHHRCRNWGISRVISDLMIQCLPKGSAMFATSVMSNYGTLNTLMSKGFRLQGRQFDSDIHPTDKVGLLIRT